MATSSIMRPGLPPGTLLVLAVACGITVANIYFSQPLLHEIARSFGVSDGRAGMVATAAQIGYACGISLVVPLADSANLGRLVRILLAVTTAGLIAGVFAEGIAALTAATLVVAVATVIPQVIMPTAASMAAPGKAGRAIAMVGVGLVMGILLSRTISGLAAEAAGTWRASYAVAALLTAALIPLLPRYMPKAPAHAPKGPSYGALLASLPRLFAAHRPVRLSAMLGACSFATFTGFWSILAFHLAQPQFGLGPGHAGLFGLWGAPGALLASQAGRLADRHGPYAVNVLASAMTVAAFIVLGLWGEHSMAALIVGCNLLGLGSGSTQIANQARIFGLDVSIRGRLNTLYMFSAFVGSALGTQASVTLYGAMGWPGLIGMAAVVMVAAAALLFINRPGAARV